MSVEAARVRIMEPALMPWMDTHAHAHQAPQALTAKQVNMEVYGGSVVRTSVAVVGGTNGDIKLRNRKRVI